MRIFIHSQAAFPQRENEDCLALRERSGASLVALADGAGGCSGGRLAAQLAVKTALSSLEKAPKWDEKALRAAFFAGDQAVLKSADAGRTTFLLAAVFSNEIRGVSVGDSVALWVRPQREVEITGGQRKNPPFGSGGAIPYFFRTKVSSGDQLLLMSDGVFRFVGLDNLARVCRQSSDETVLADLLELQSQRDGILPDDWSAALVRL